MASAKPDRFDCALIELIKEAFRSGADFPLLGKALTLAASDNIESPDSRIVLVTKDSHVKVLTGIYPFKR
ncbi:hypothetical protein A7985_11595 [Pseudoalteromonas luteoviolacea]|uniref:Uncharacterized protein n=1 Tax=Pseudoalteromonas luteoviolacea TaxID=43657 RepID=A0A1C0TQP4_9GAMM|nr:hypothetical protein [Pseudoalteromonas luteoviolacea]OCQ21264.1 hypothetical protein A7985_11595 [Pseudoalteromonas luteoviolacea]